MFDFLFFIYCGFIFIVVSILFMLNQFIIGLIVVLIGVAIGYKLYTKHTKKEIKQKEEHKVFLQKLHNLIYQHRGALASEKDKLTIIDSYGHKNYDNWFTMGILYFIDKVLINDLSISGRDWVSWNRDYVYKLIDDIAEAELKFIKNSRLPLVFKEDMTGVEYELFCKKILEEDNWSIQTTQTSGDQGVDLIAKQGNLTIAIQCKRSNSSIGNAAVQEIVAGANHYKTQYAIVVSNTFFTPQAKMLANTNRVLLLHHNDLNNLYSMLSNV